MMAGEIGASVIVVKEIEVPAALVGLAGQETDSRNSKRSARRSGTLTPAGLLSHSSDSPPSNTEPETDTSTTDTTDIDDDMPKGTNSDPELFQMDPEPNPADSAPISSSIPVELEISSVYKPRPVRKRPAHAHPLLGTHRQARMNHKRAQLEESKATILASSKTLLAPKSIKHDAPIQDGTVAPTQTKQQAKQVARRFARDRRREERKKAVTAAHSAATSSPEMKPVSEDETLVLNDVETGRLSPEESRLVSSLEGLHVGVQPVFTAEPEPLTSVPKSSLGNTGVESPSTEDVVAVHSMEPRLIVEALVVRKLSLEDSFLDFGGFSLM